MYCALKVSFVLLLLAALVITNNASGQKAQRFLTLAFCDIVLDGRTRSMFFLDESGDRWDISIVAPNMVPKINIPDMPQELAKIFPKEPLTIGARKHELVVEGPGIKRQLLVPGSNLASELRGRLELGSRNTQYPGDTPLVSALQQALENDDANANLLREFSNWIKISENYGRAIKAHERNSTETVE